MKESEKAIFTIMQAEGRFDYGSVIPQAEIHELFEIEVPEQGTFKDYQSVALEELNVIGAIRTELIKVGKYIKKDGLSYRILLPNENSSQADAMVDSAKRKLTRAQNLLKNTDSALSEHRVDSSLNMQGAIARMEKRSNLMR